jgi:hypothetical protein
MSQPQMMSQQEFPDDFGEFNSQADKFHDDIGGSSLRGRENRDGQQSKNRPFGPGSSQSQFSQVGLISFCL